MTSDQVSDPADFWELVEGYRPYLKGVARRVLGTRLQDKVDASDVVQDALLAAAKCFAQFRGKTVAEWQAWLVKVVRNEALGLLKYWSQEMRDPAREEPPGTGRSGGPHLAADSSSPSQKAASRERAARLLAAIDRLPPNYREVIQLRQFESLPYADVAARMGRSEPAVRQLWVSALKRLEMDLGDDL